MTTAEFKKIARLLKEAYKELEDEALKSGVSLLSKEYDEMQTRVREAVLESQGFTLEEYRSAKAKVAGFSQADLVDETEKIDGKVSQKVAESIASLQERVEQLERTHIPDEEEIEDISNRVAQKYIKPPQITNQIVERIEKPKIIKETVKVREEYNDKPLRKELKNLYSKIEGLPRLEELQDEFLKPVQSIKDSIEIKWGKNMPDFRKLAMGLQAQIDAGGSGGGTWGSITGTLSDQTDLQSALDAKAPTTSPTFATSVTGSYLTASELLITDGSKNIVSAPVATYPSLTELSYVKGLTSSAQTQINTKANTAGSLTQFVGNTAWRVFYSDADGDITELALGADGTFLKSNGAAAAPTFATPAGTGDVSKVGTPSDDQLAVWTGDGTLEGTSDVSYNGTSFNIVTGKNFQIAGATILADAAGTTTLSNIDALDATTIATFETAMEANIDTLSSLTSIGTIGTGVWQGTTIKANYLQQAAADLGDADITVDLSNSNAGNVTNLTIDGTFTAVDASLSNDLLLASASIINFNSGDITLTHSANNLTMAGGNFVLSEGQNILNLNNTDYTNTAGAGSVLHLKNANASGQTVVYSEINGNLVAKWRTDYVGNISWCSTANTTQTGHHFYINGDYPTGSIKLAVGSGGVAVGSWTGASPSAPSYNLHVFGTFGTSGAATLGGNLAMSTNSITMTGSLAATGARVTKGWFTDIESTNMPTVGGVAILTSLTAPQFTTIELGHASDTTLSRVSAGVVAIEGVNILTTAGGTLTGNITLGENTSIALDPAGSADGKYSGITIAGTAGAALAFGDLVYLAAADSRWELADADAAATADRMLGMVVLAAAGDGSATTILLHGNIRADAAFPALTIGSPVYVGETAGDVQTAIPTGADNVIRRVGYALTADELYFAPSMDSQITVA